jgi:quinohemoprotein ethanol dehydrogenase
MGELILQLSKPGHLTAAALLAAGIIAGAVRASASPSSRSNSDWMSYGGANDDQHYSALEMINAGTIAHLGLAWSFDIPGTVMAVSTPLEVNGTLYFVVGYGVVRALDAQTGKLLWEFNPDAERAPGASLKMRLDWGVRGIAYGDEKIYVGTMDGRLLAIRSADGKLAWSTQTTEPGDGRFISGPPKYFDGRVIIGHGGGDNSYVRGYVTAYDARTGAKLWRFFTVPGDPAKGFENGAMKRAAKTWSGEWWKYGGGGTVWNAITYDADFDRIYIGTGNGTPWNPKIRNPAGGDGLFTCSIVALDARTGAYAWHYQESPNDAWDYDATQDLELATLSIGGKPRKVLMQAAKDGFYYVLDRGTGKLLSADKFGRETWAERIDLKSGRPVESPNARYQRGGVSLWPAPIGEHNWHPMSFNPRTGLAYIPSFSIGARFTDANVDVKHWADPPLGEGKVGLSFDIVGPGISSLIAFDPLRHKVAWTVPLEPGVHGGTLTTGGNLVFQGRADGKLLAYDAAGGDTLWSYDAKDGIVGAPISYSVAGQQYVSVVVSYSGFASMFGDVGARYGWDARTQARRVLTFKLGGTAVLPPRLAAGRIEPIADPDYVADPQREAAGAESFAERCMTCHGPAAMAGGQGPDLRASSLILSTDGFKRVLHDALLQAQGMPGFAELSDDEIEALRQYVRARAHSDRAGVEKRK